jgi:hypothetical protein
MFGHVWAKVTEELGDFRPFPITAIQGKLYATHITQFQDFTSSFEKNQKLIPQALNSLVLVVRTQVLHG